MAGKYFHLPHSASADCPYETDTFFLSFSAVSSAAWWAVSGAASATRSASTVLSPDEGTCSFSFYRKIIYVVIKFYITSALFYRSW